MHLIGLHSPSSPTNAVDVPVDLARISEVVQRLSISMRTMANEVLAAETGTLEGVGEHQKPLTESEAELVRVKREPA